VNWNTRKGVAVNQTTGVRHIVGVVLDDLTLKHAEKDFIKRQAIGARFLIRVIGDSDPVVAYRVNDVFDVHIRHSSFGDNHRPRYLHVIQPLKVTP
jgi:hypothetical protein